MGEWEVGGVGSEGEWGAKGWQSNHLDSKNSAVPSVFDIN